MINTPTRKGSVLLLRVDTAIPQAEVRKAMERILDYPLS